MEKQKIIDELTELLNIPQFERIIYHKIEELKTYFRDEISLYTNLKKDFQKAAYGNMQIFENEEHIRSQTYRFELDRNEDNLWIPTEIEPPPPSMSEISNIIPPEIIEYITNFKSNPTKIETINNFTLPTLRGKMYNLRFAKYSDHHALGTITEIRTKKETQHQGAEADNLVDINDYYKEDTVELNYKELMYYMEKFPAFKEHVFSEFFMRWKPLIDEKLLKLP
jgi:hypothetical protein